MSTRTMGPNVFKAVFCCLLCLTFFSCDPGVRSHEERLTSEFSLDQLQADFTQLRDTLENNHPDRFRYETEGELNQLFDTAYDSLQENMTEMAFYRVVAPLVARYHCMHTRVTPSTAFFREIESDGRVFPLGISLIDGKAYVDADYGSGSGIPVGSEIMSINGQKIPGIVDRIMAGLNSDAMNVSSKIRRINRMFYLYYYFFWGPQEQFNLMIKPSGGGAEIPFQISARPFSEVDRASLERFSRSNLMVFELNESEGSAVLTVPSFIITLNPGYRSFFENVFSQMNDRGVDHLIIDVRGNGGGDPVVAATLLSYLLDEPFVYFKSGSGYENMYFETSPNPIHFDGTVYILIDGGSISTTGHFCELIRHFDAGIFVGETGGGTYRCHDGHVCADLYHTGIRLQVSRVTYEAAVPDHDVSEGFVPDYRIVPSIDDILDGIDPQMDYTIQLISHGDDIMMD